jgi:glucose-1-phosphate thymidylyltransferase
VQCIILCGGFATRLRPLTLDRPKHLLLIAGRPMLDHLLDRLAASGIPRGIVVTNHRFIGHFRDWAAGQHALAVNVLDDGSETNEARLGSIGDLRFGLEAADVREDFMVVNGDNLFTFSLDPVFETFRRCGNTIALYDVGSFEVARLMGHASCDATGRVTDFVEKPPQPASTLASIGIYLYQSGVRGLVNRYLADGHSPDRTGDFVKWLHRQVLVYGHAIPGSAGVWYDIGSFDQYQEANRAFGGQPIEMTDLGGPAKN